MIAAPQICIVDDADDYRLVLEKLFKRQLPLYSVALFASGSDFWEALSQFDQAPSLILLDRHMPGLDGHQTLLRLKQHATYRRIPVVMMSAHASIQEIDGCYEACANSFLTKPVDFSVLQQQLTLICQYWLETNRKPTVLI